MQITYIFDMTIKIFSKLHKQYFQYINFLSFLIKMWTILWLYCSSHFKKQLQKCTHCEQLGSFWVIKADVISVCDSWINIYSYALLLVDKFVKIENQSDKITTAGITCLKLNFSGKLLFWNSSKGKVYCK